MNLLPTNIGPLSVIADAKEGTRWACTGIQFESMFDGNGMPAGWRACATDARRLLRVSGGDVGPIDEYPLPPAVESAPNGATKALIPAAKWDAFFKQAAKLTAKKYLKPVLKSVLVKIGENRATFAATDLDSCPVEQTKLLEGKFPPVDDIIPKKLRTGASVIFFDSRMLAETLNAINAMVPKDQTSIIRVESRTNSKPVHISSKSCPGLNIEGIIMPFGIDRADYDYDYDPIGRRDRVIKRLLAKRHNAPDDSLPVVKEHDQLCNAVDVEESDDQKEIDRLANELDAEREKVAKLLAELDQWKQTVKDLRIVEDKCRELVIERNVLQAKLESAEKRASDRLCDTATLANVIEKSNIAADQSNPAPKLTRAERLAKLKS